LATAILLSRSGHRVFGTVLDRSETPETPAFEQVELDVRDDESVERGVTDILEKAGRIDALVNNASICVIGGLEK
jgi:NAD(P)-dependent dehydrogenase (short-subunit alcohol dehydrogenase family)